MSEFEKELRELMEKHNVKLIESENYDGEENYSGSNYFFVHRDKGILNTGLFLDVSDLVE